MTAQVEGDLIFVIGALEVAGFARGEDVKGILHALIPTRPTLIFQGVDVPLSREVKTCYP